MKIKIWGARGSTPAPLRPGAVREKIISALLGIAQLEKGELREKLIAALLENPEHTAPPASGMYEKVQHKIQAQRRQVIETYLDKFSSLVVGTAGGNTPCLEIRSGDDLFIIDAGSGIRELGLELMQGPCGRGEGVIHLLFSHPHWDHIQGFPFFRPAFIPGNQIFIYGVHDMEAVLRRQQEFINFPVSLDYMQAAMTFKRIAPSNLLDFGDLRIRTIRNHHPGDSYGYRFEKGNKTFVYASDAAYPDGVDLRPYLNFFADADLLIFDAQFTQRESDEKEDWGHSSSFVGVEMAQQADVKTLVLFHYDPTYSDVELEGILKDALRFQQNQYPAATPVKIIVAQEGQTFDLTPPKTTQVQHVPGSEASILKPSGVFDEHVAAELRDQLAGLSETQWPAQLIIDMKEVQLLQVAGLRALVKLRKDHQSTPMALVGPSDSVRQLIDLAGYTKFFAVYPSVHAALKALKARETLNLPGQVLKGRYKVESKIGEGRLGTVFKAIDTQQNNRPMAIKILSPSFSEGAIQQFLRHARQIVDLIHPNIANVYDCDEDRGISFMAEELIIGQTLRALMDQYPDQPLPFDLAINIARSITRALEYAHTHNVIHGDLKPKNVLLADEVKISDFGLGRLESGKSLINIDIPLALVTARYLAPEQVLGHPIDDRTDLYALGVILYELFTGQPPFDGSDHEVMEHHRSTPPRLPRQLNPQLSHTLEHLILKLLDKDPNKRYATARQVRHILTSMTVAISGESSRHPFTNDPSPRLVGRTEELKQLNALWAKTQQGQGQVVFIKGPAGAGKSRLVWEFLHGLDQATVLIGHGQNPERGPVYHPFVSALNTYLERVPAEVSGQTVGPVWQETLTLVPEAAQLLIKSTSASQEGEAEGAGVLPLLRRVSQGQPWVVFVDDLHLADPSSLALFGYLARHCRQMPLMMVGAYPDKAQAETEELARLLSHLETERHLTSLSLAPLSEEAVRVLLEEIWSPEAPPELTTAIGRHTNGLPLFVIETARALMSEGTVNWQEGKWFFETAAETVLPQTLSEAMLRQLEQFSRETRTLLNQAAILGPAIRFADLNEMSDLSEWDALESLNVALEHQILTESPGENRVRFSHAQLRQVICSQLSALKQRLMHREAGEALERRYAPDTAAVAEALGYHFFQAGELEKALRYSRQAAARAIALSAQPGALYWYTQALDVIDQLGPAHVSPQQRFDLLLAREQIFANQGMRDLQLADLTSLRRLAQQLADPARQAVVHNRQAAYEHGLGRLTEALTEARTGLIAARQADQPRLVSHSLLQLAHLAWHQGKFAAAQEQLQQAHQTLQASGLPGTEARVMAGLGDLFKALSDYPASEKYYRQALTLSELGHDRRRQAAYLSRLGDLLLLKGDFSQALGAQNQALSVAQLVGCRSTEATCLSRLAALYREAGAYKLARHYIDQSLTLWRTLENELGLAGALRVQGAIFLATWDYGAARDYVGQALEIFQRLRCQAEHSDTWLTLGLALEGLGDLAKAGHAYEQTLTLAAQLKIDHGVLDARAGLARCRLAQGKTEAAQRQVAICLETLQTDQARGVRYPIRLYLTIYRVFQAINDLPEAMAALQQGQLLLHKRADKITEASLRSSFLENVPENKELLAQLDQREVEELTGQAG